MDLLPWNHLQGLSSIGLVKFPQDIISPLIEWVYDGNMFEDRCCSEASAPYWSNMPALLSKAAMRAPRHLLRLRLQVPTGSVSACRNFSAAAMV